MMMRLKMMSIMMMSLVMMTVVMIIIVLTRPPGDSDLYSPCKHIMMTKPKLAGMGGQEEMNGNGTK